MLLHRSPFPSLVQRFRFSRQRSLAPLRLPLGSHRPLGRATQSTALVSPPFQHPLGERSPLTLPPTVEQPALDATADDWTSAHQVFAEVPTEDSSPQSPEARATDTPAATPPLDTAENSAPPDSGIQEAHQPNTEALPELQKRSEASAVEPTPTASEQTTPQAIPSSESGEESSSTIPKVQAPNRSGAEGQPEVLAETSANGLEQTVQKAPLEEESDRPSSEPSLPPEQPAQLQRQPTTPANEGDEALSLPAQSTPSQSNGIMPETTQAASLPAAPIKSQEDTQSPAPTPNAKPEPAQRSEPDVQFSDPPVVQSETTAPAAPQAPSSQLAETKAIQAKAESTAPLQTPSPQPEPSPSAPQGERTTASNPPNPVPASVETSEAATELPRLQRQPADDDKREHSEGAIASSSKAATTSPESLQAQPSQDADVPQIAPRREHPHAILLKPLGQSKSLANEAIATPLSVPSASDTDKAELLSSDTIQPDSPHLPNGNRPTIQQKQDLSSRSNETNEAPSEDVPSTSSVAPSTSNAASDSKATETSGDAQSPAIQRQALQGNESAQNHSPQSVPGKWSDISELLQSDATVYHTADPVHYLIESSDGEEADDSSPEQGDEAKTSEASKQKDTSNASAKESKKQPGTQGDRPPSAQALEQSLECLVYPVYWLLRQHWSRAGERQGDGQSGEPVWWSDGEWSDRPIPWQSPTTNASSSGSADHFIAVLEPPVPGSPLYAKLQDLSAEINVVIQSRRAIERERDGQYAPSHLL